jgi:hypothetical protein
MSIAVLAAVTVSATSASIAGTSAREGLAGLGPTAAFAGAAVLIGLLLIAGPALISPRIRAESLRRP